MKVRVRLFASFAELAGWREKDWDVPEGATAGDLLASLRRGPLIGLPPKTTPLLAVDRQHCGPDRALVEGDEVAVFPPVSGGAGSETAPVPPRVGPEPLDGRLLAESVRHPSCGAVVTFEGIVREESDGRRVEAIEYEAYVEMAEKILAELVAEVEARHPGVRLALAHRTGRLVVGEASVVVAAAAPHRRQAFAACRLAMDRIKEVLPAWKRDVFSERRPTA